MREAVTAIFVHQGKILNIKRQTHLSVFPGYTSFPGGKVDKTDSSNPVNYDLLKDFEPVLIHALRREIIEEINVDIFKMVDDEKILQFDHIGIAVTPEFNPYRFKTHFFKIHVKDFLEINVDDNEVESTSWDLAKDLLKKYKKAEILAVPPTIKLIEALAERLDRVEPIDLDLHFKSVTEVPMIESVCGVKQFLPLSNTFPPAKRTNCFLIGDSGEEILIDPSPCDDNEYNKLKNSISSYKIKEIFLTHHHPDHHEFAPQLAKELQVPIGLSLDTLNRINKIWGEDYFKGIEIKYYNDGDILNQSLGQKVKVYEVPGHDEGQLALAPDSLNWFIVGDLIQTIGTVVIGGDEGDMRKYFESLRKVIYLNPKVIFPSHGIALGGVDKLKMTLKHRQHREEQIMLLLDQGKSNQEILDEVYEGLNPKLHKYALKTIEAHIKKIKIDDENTV